MTKKWIAPLLALMMCLSFVACGENASTDNTVQSTAPLTAVEQLTKEERQLFDALIKMTKEDFYEPSSVRVLEIGDHDPRTKWADFDTLYGPDTIVVRLQGENRVGGTLNHYYRVCIVACENMSDIAQSFIESYSFLGDKNKVLDYKGEVGDYAQLSDSYSIEKDASDTYSIGRINKALTEYWEDMGF